MNKNIQRADFTQYENLLLQVGCHYSPGAKTTLKMLKLPQLPVLSTHLWKLFAKCVSFSISRNPSPFMTQDQTTTISKKLVSHRKRNSYMMRGRVWFCTVQTVLRNTRVPQMLRGTVGKRKIQSRKSSCRQIKNFVLTTNFSVFNMLMFTGKQPRTDRAGRVLPKEIDQRNIFHGTNTAPSPITSVPQRSVWKHLSHLKDKNQKRLEHFAREDPKSCLLSSTKTHPQTSTLFNTSQTGTKGRGGS